MAELWKSPKAEMYKFNSFRTIILSHYLYPSPPDKRFEYDYSGCSYATSEPSVAFEEFCRWNITTFYKLPYNIWTTAMNSRHHAKASYLNTENRCLPRLSIILEYLQAEIISAIAWVAGQDCSVCPASHFQDHKMRQPVFQNIVI